MALQRQIGSTFVTVLWFRKTEIQDRAGILVLVRVSRVMIKKMLTILAVSSNTYLKAVMILFFLISIE